MRGLGITLIIILLVMGMPFVLGTTKKMDPSHVQINSQASLDYQHPNNRQDICHVLAQNENDNGHRIYSFLRTTQGNLIFYMHADDCNDLDYLDPIIKIDTFKNGNSNDRDDRIVEAAQSTRLNSQTEQAVLTGLAFADHHDESPVLRMDKKTMSKWWEETGTYTLQHAKICLERANLKFDQISSSLVSPDNFIEFVIEGDGQNQCYDNVFVKSPAQPIAVVDDKTKKYEGWMVAEDKFYNIPLFCDAVHLTITDVESGDWDFAKNNGNPYVFNQNKKTDSYADGSNSFTFEIEYDDAEKRLTSFRIELNDQSGRAGGFAYKVECINPPDIQTWNYACIDAGGAYELPGVTFTSGPKCCIDSTLGDYSSDGTTDYTCTQLGSVYQWIDSSQIVACNGGETLASHPNYCCDAQNAESFFPHSSGPYDPNAPYWCEDQPSTHTPSTGSQYMLKATDQKDPWAFYDGPTSDNWLECTSPGTAAGNFLCTTNSTNEPAWERCECGASVGRGPASNCGQSTKEPSWYCAPEDTWTQDPATPGACIIHSRLGEFDPLADNDPSTNICCYMGIYTADFLPGVWRGCFNGLIIQEDYGPDGNPPAIWEVTLATQ